MVRVVLGLLKGGAIGGLVGWGALKLGVGAGVLAFVTYGIIGGLVGVICGRPPWRQDTFWTSGLKGIFGALVGAGLYWVARKVFGDAHVGFAASLGAGDRPLVEIPLLLGPVVGALWGLFIEVDDGAGAAKAASKATPTPAKKK